jgi:ribosomal protein S18 acetylase RimI-like enzyme
MPLPRLLTPEDAAAYLAIRLEMLADSPWAFLSSPEEPGNTVEVVAQRLSQPENEILGVFGAEGGLLSVAGVYRSDRDKTRHKAHVWGVYTTPGARGQGFGHTVVQSAVGVARSWAGVEVISLSCSARATAALAMYRDLGFEIWGTEPDAMRVGGESAEEVHMAFIPGEG